MFKIGLNKTHYSDSTVTITNQMTIQTIQTIQNIQVQNDNNICTTDTESEDTGSDSDSSHNNIKKVKKIKSDDSSDSDDIDDNVSESGESVDAFDIDPVKFFSVKELCYYKLITKFFSTCESENISKMINIVEGKSTMSLRVLDWFVAKYSKKRIDCGTTKDAEMFDVRISYKSQLKSYKKRYFDPFRRKKKFNYNFKNGMSMKTTLGQLNFFKWAFTNNIVVYVDKNLKHIIKEMKIANKEVDKKKDTKKKDTKKKKSSGSGGKSTKLKKQKKGLDSDNSGNIKINNSKLNRDSEIQFTLVFD